MKPIARSPPRLEFAGPLPALRPDKSPGQILFQNVDDFGGTWLVVRPSGQLFR